MENGENVCNSGNNQTGVYARITRKVTTACKRREVKTSGMSDW